MTTQNAYGTTYESPLPRTCRSRRPPWRYLAGCWQADSSAWHCFLAMKLTSCAGHGTLTQFEVAEREERSSGRASVEHLQRPSEAARRAARERSGDRQEAQAIRLCVLPGGMA